MSAVPLLTVWDTLTVYTPAPPLPVVVYMYALGLIWGAPLTV
jgi:hypothetical protein